MRALSSSVASVRSSVRFSRATTKDGPHHSPPFLLFGNTRERVILFVTTGTGRRRRRRRRLLKKAVDDDDAASSVLLSSSSFAEEAESSSVMSSMDEILLSPPDSDIITEDIAEMHKRDLTNESIENVTPSPQTAKVTSIAELLAFTLPTMAIWLCDPILSLLDTAMVGLTSTIELAAISPASVYVGHTCYILCSAFAVSATALIARDRIVARRKNTPEAVEEDARTVNDVLVLSAGVGCIIAASLFAFHIPGLTKYVGANSLVLIPHAATYTKIRLLAFPAAIACAVMQSAHLATEDPYTPLKATLVAAAVNGLGDFIAVFCFNAGIAGVAWATAFAQIVVTTLFVRAMIVRGKKCDARKYDLGYRLNGPPPLRMPLRLPSLKAIARIGKIATPVFFVTLVKAVFVGSTIRSGTALGPAFSAANGVMFTVYFFFAVIGDGVSQAAQTFLPAQLGDETRAFEMTKRLLLAALCIGCFSAVFSRIVPVYFPYFFTTDSTVAALMKEISPVSSLALLLHTSSMASEGCLLAGRDTRFMSLAYVPNALLAWIGLSLTLKAGLGIRAAWFALAQFHFVRLTVNSARLLSRQSPLRKQLKED